VKCTRFADSCLPRALMIDQWGLGESTGAEVVGFVQSRTRVSKCPHLSGKGSASNTLGWDSLVRTLGLRTPQSLPTR
jgi:hypothetical protein